MSAMYEVESSLGCGTLTIGPLVRHNDKLRIPITLTDDTGKTTEMHASSMRCRGRSLIEAYTDAHGKIWWRPRRKRSKR